MSIFLTDFSSNLEGALTQNPIHIARLEKVYEDSERLIECAGWSTLQQIENPQILLCGTASPTTSETYYNFVTGYNPGASVCNLDLSYHPISLSELQGIQANALYLPFCDGSFDRIETDRFLQFFNPWEMQLLISEWCRVLRPGGIITTRDHVVNSYGDAILGKFTRALIKSFGLPNYELTEKYIKQVFNTNGFDVLIENIGLSGVKLPLISTIIAKKTTSNLTGC